MKAKTISIKVFVLITFIVMVAMNALANIIPINGITTGEVSDSYPNLFAPTGLTFAIWGVIYILLAVYTIYQLIAFKPTGYSEKAHIFKSVGIAFSISSVANTIWILAWHYGNIPLSLVLMLVILVCLAVINLILKNNRFTLAEKLLIKLPFSVYFGWITVATIANVTTLLVDLQWGRFGLSEVLLTIIILFVGVLISVATIMLNRDVAYGLVIIWAYVGILIKHISESGFNWGYFSVVVTVVICLALLIATEVYLIFFKKSRTIY
ncbi:MAG: tryptophan-rich sensory protein [Dethiosulfatibacter sp.]|nr:tryptophan-rich sensory protein [Dethiosulfatibacter sp.]